MKKTYMNDKKIFIISFCHIIISFIYSGFFFTKLIPAVGSENKSYSYLATGSDLSQDMVSRLLCAVSAYLLSAFLIYIFWYMLFGVIKMLKQKEQSVFFFVFVAVIGIVFILCLYPKMYGVETTDDYMNLAYAMEFLPMYWHGFWTDVVYCACMILFPNPISVPLIQFVFAIYVVYYFFSELIKYISGRKKQVFVLATIVLAIPLTPEIIRIFICPTRNCMYAILAVYGISILFSDYQSKKKLTNTKFILLCILFAFIGTWRGEGVLYLLVFPILAYIVYYVTKDGKKILAPLSQIKYKKKIAKELFLFVIICLLFMFPDKYGVAKYQNSDYMIANTTGPLSAILMDENANLSYTGIDEDLKNIKELIPLEYIKKYGCNSCFYYNALSGRFVRQSGSTKEEGTAYVKSALRIMTYNLPIWLKYQMNMFMMANQIRISCFDVNYGKEGLEEWQELEPYVRAFELYDCGENFLQEKEILNLDAELDQKLEEGLSSMLNKIYDAFRKKMSWYKIVLVVATIMCSVVAWVKREWLSLFLLVLNFAVLCVIILMAPWGRGNYYYSVFISMFVTLMYFVKLNLSNDLFKKRIGVRG